MEKIVFFGLGAVGSAMMPLTIANQQAAGEYLGSKFLTPRTQWWLRRIFGYQNFTIDSLPDEMSR